MIEKIHTENRALKSKLGSKAKIIKHQEAVSAYQLLDMNDPIRSAQIINEGKKTIGELNRQTDAAAQQHRCASEEVEILKVSPCAGSSDHFHCIPSKT